MRFRKGFWGFGYLTLDLDSGIICGIISVFGREQRAAVGYNPKKKRAKSYRSLPRFIGGTRSYLGGKYAIRIPNKHRFDIVGRAAAFEASSRACTCEK
jgi:hypothetical protein